MSRARIYGIVCAVALIAVVIAGSAFYIIRDRAITHLFAQANGAATVEAQKAVEQLGTYSGQDVTLLLLRIARGQTSFPWPEVQRTAIQALVTRKDVANPNALADLLQPYENSAVRLATAKALTQLDCGQYCTRSVIHYLERISAGEMNYEDLVKSSFPPDFQAGVDTLRRKDQQALYDVLYDVLRRNARSTADTLVEVYGFGTDAPSAFALRLTSKARLTQACPALSLSNKLIGQTTMESFVAPRKEVLDTLASLNCK